jgi:hypothetical protein
MADTLISDLIQLPERVTKNDFVLKITEGMTDPKATLGNYVVTPELVRNFDDAVGFIKGAVVSKKSQGTYLHGSFGSGKSHFMAVLNLLLAGNTDALSLPKMAPVVAKHGEWLRGRKFLMVGYHMIGAKSLEDAIFDGYIAWLREHHPDAELPALFRSIAILENAAALRKTMGDETFFKTLNHGKAAGGGNDWGSLSDQWSPEAYDEAAADPLSENHDRLVSDVVEKLITSVRHEGQYLDLDKGLAKLSRHAERLGYQAVILFLDELVLWLASNSGNLDFLNREVNKLAKLVEAQDMKRPVPVISFIARQRDLRELIGANVDGAQNLNFIDQLKYFEGRFETIKLGDNNLPEIAAERILRPRDAAARKLLDDEFERTAKVRSEVRDILLTSTSDAAAWRKLYPFSPALVETLVAISSLLQRERTALKIMLQLLVDQRDTLKLGQLVPVGDLYDLFAQGDDAFSKDMGRVFLTADKLYRQHLRPMLEHSNSLTFDDAAKLPETDPKRNRLRNDDRLIKTLLLAALAPEVESLKNLTPQRLAALNHGTIKSPIPGQEAAQVLAKFQEWCGQVGQLKLSDSTPPVIALQLSEVDVEAIIAKAEIHDNFGNRLRLVKDLLYEQFTITQGDTLWSEYELRWRGTDRRCTVVFKNVWEADDGTLEALDDGWKLVIDYPLDQQNKGPQDDRVRLDDFKRLKKSTRTIVWLPSFFSDQALRDLGRLAKLQHILSPHGFDGYVSDLSVQDRQTAKSILDSQRNALRARLLTNVQTAYGLREDRTNTLDPMRRLEGSQQFISLDDALTLNVPGESHLKEAMDSLLDQALTSQFPAHPRFEEEAKLTPAYVQRVLEAFEGALQEEGMRYEVEKPMRGVVRMIAGPLKLGDMGQTHFVPGEHWKDHFRRKAPQGLQGVKVGELRQWLDDPTPWGLPRVLQNLIILAVAAQLNCSFSHNGGPAEVTLKDLRDEFELTTQQLPTLEAWEKARVAAEIVLGVPGLSKLLNAQSVAEFSEKIRREALALETNAGLLIARLEETAAQVVDKFARLEAAREARGFLDKVRKRQGAELVDALAAFAPTQPAEAIATSLKKAPAVLAVLPLELKALDSALALGEPYGSQAEALAEKLRDALARNELVVALAPVVTRVKDQAVDILAKAASASKPFVKDDEKPTTPNSGTGVPPPLPSLPPSVEGKQLKKQYRHSQVAGDPLPPWLPDELIEEVLETCRVKGCDRNIVVTPTVRRLLEVCPDAVLDEHSGKLRIPSKKIELQVKFER